jgi:hypothetical protein
MKTETADVFLLECDQCWRRAKKVQSADADTNFFQNVTLEF